MKSTPIRLHISAPVGKKVKTNADDVAKIQKGLNDIKAVWGTAEAPLTVDGKMSDDLDKAIRRFQKRNFGWEDGLVEPHKNTIKQMEQILNGGVDIVVIEGAGAPDNGFDKEARELWDGELEVLSVAQMVTKVLDLLNQDSTKKIQTLVIVGHGSEGVQGVGDGTGLDPTGAKNLQVDPATKDDKPPKLLGDAQQQMQKLRGKFTDADKKPIIILEGCHVAKGEEGKRLLKAVSGVVGVNVEASVATQYSSKPGMEGICIRCNSGSCWVVNGGKYWWGPK
jgi:hypothetical protein